MLFADFMLDTIAFVFGIAITLTLIELLRSRGYRWTLWLVIPVIVAAVSMVFVSIESLKGIPTKKLPEGKWVMLGHKVVPDKAIYLWLGIKGEEKPISVELPYTDEMAEKIQKAAREGKKNGTPTIGQFKKNKRGTEESLDTELWQFKFEERFKKDDDEATPQTPALTM